MAFQRTPLAHYVKPLLWLGEPPSWAGRGSAIAGPVDADELKVQVYETSFPIGVRMRGYRDGMFLFDFGDWGDPPTGEDFDSEAAYQVRCVRFMNAHLACLTTTAMWVNRATPIMPGQTLRMNEDGEFMSAGGFDSDFEIWKARMGEFHRADERIMRGTHVTVEEIAAATELLTEMLSTSNQALTLLRAELIYRSAAAYGNHDQNSALVYAWIAAESVLGELLAVYLHSQKDRPVDTDGKFMPSDRRKFFESSQTTARHTAEILSLADRLPFPLYESVIAALRARNRWLHRGVEATKADAIRAITAAQALLALAGAPKLEMPLSQGLH